MDRTDPAYRGQSDYTPLLLRLYDPLVLGPIARYVWRCPSPRLLEHYRQHIREPHLDVGPGTGYFVEQSPAGGQPSHTWTRTGTSCGTRHDGCRTSTSRPSRQMS